MNNGFPLVPLGDVMDLSIDAVAVDPATSYPISGVYSFGRGLFAREPLAGSETTYKVFHRLHANDFVLSKLKAWEGALAKIPAAFDGWFLSPQFPTFRANPDRLDIDYLSWYCKLSRVWDALRNKSRGMGARRDSVSPKTFLALQIPLPPLPEQRRIVARIEELAARIEEARGLRRRAFEEAKALMRSALNQTAYSLLGSHEPQALNTLTTFVGDMNHEMPKAVEQGVPLVSPKDFGPNGTIEFAAVKQISREDFVRLSRKCCPQRSDILLARYGTIGAARFVDTSQEFLASYSIAVIRPDLEKVEARFLYWMIVSPYIQNQAIEGIRGSGMADLGLNTIRQFSIPTLTRHEQRQVVEYLDDLQAKVASLKQLQAETAAELDALLPSVLDRAFKGKL